MGAIVLVGGLHLTKYRTPVAAVGAANKKYKRVNIIHPIAAWMPKAVYKQRHGGTHSIEPDAVLITAAYEKAYLYQI